MKSDFIFTLCNKGNEDLLKTEVSHFFPQWKFSYNRQGFITFKLDRPYQIEEVPHLFFSRRTGLCLGRSPLPDGRWPVQEFNLIEMNGPSANAKPGETVLNCIQLSPTEIWYGLHIQKKNELSSAGAWTAQNMPEESPSRAYQKLAQAQDLFSLDFKKGQTALELGSAPGGAAYFLLQQGLKVVGVDPAVMAEVCLQNPQFTHLKLTAQEIKKEHLPQNLDWILSDLNLAPPLAMKQILYITKFFPRLKGILLTAKITDKIYIQEMPDLFSKLTQVTQMKIDWAQLPSHGQEFLVLLRAK